MEISMKLATLAGSLLFAANAYAIDQAQIDSMVARAAVAQSSEYLRARDEILDTGTNALPFLGRAAVSTNVSWRHRLEARICYERILRFADIRALRATDWNDDPGYNKDWRHNITGDSYSLGAVVTPKCRELGLWYYYIELTWKNTREYSTSTRERSTLRFNAAWPWYLSAAVTNQPELYWLDISRLDVLAHTDFRDSYHQGIFETYMRNRTVDAVPMLVQRFDDFFKHEVLGPEIFPGRHAQLYCGMFDSIIAFADTRHAVLIERFISEHPALAPLKEKVAEVRARPAPPPRQEPLFRLNQTPVPIPES